MFCRRSWILCILALLVVPALGQTAAELAAQGDALFREVWLTQYTLGSAPELQAQLEQAIALYEQALAQDENHVHVLNMLARGYFTLADVFLPDEEEAPALRKGREYGERSLRTNPEFVRVERERGFVEAVRTSTDASALFWTYANWARAVELGGALGLLAAALRGDDRKLMALMERCVELDRGYVSGAPLRALAGYWAKHPFRRDPELVRVLLEEAIAAHPEFLDNLVFYAKYYLIPAEKWAQAREALQRVIDAPIGVDALQNGSAKIKAVDLLAEIEGK